MVKKAISYGPLFIALAATLWALDGVLRRNLFTLLPIIIVFYEHLIGSAFFAPYILKNIRTFRFSRNEIGALLIVSLFSSVLGTLWFTTALVRVEFIPFSVVLLLQKLQPIFAIVTATLLLKETISKQYAIWAIIALISGYFIMFPTGVAWNENTETIHAALYAIGAAAAWGSGTAFSRYILKKHSATTTTAMRFLFSAIISGVLIVIGGKTSYLSSPSSTQLLQLILIAFSTGMVALWIYYKGLRSTQVKVSTIVELIFPAVAVFIDIVVYKSVLTPVQYLAALILLFAIFKTAQLNSRG